MTLTAPTRETVAEADGILHRVVATPEGHRDPYPLYRALREVAPVYRSDLDGNWYVSSFDACRHVLGDARIGKNDQFVVPRHGVDAERVRLARRRSRPSMITSNPPEHTRLRGSAKGAFIPPRIEELRFRVSAIVDERVDRLAELGEADILDELEAYFLDLIAQRRRQPAGDLLSGFVAQQEQGLMVEEEVFATVSLLFIAGFLTVGFRTF